MPGGKSRQQVGISPKNAIADAREAKAIAKQIAADIDGSASALEWMEHETEYADQITNYRINTETRNCEDVLRECDLKRGSPLTDSEEVPYGKVLIGVNYLAEGWKVTCRLFSFSIYSCWSLIEPRWDSLNSLKIRFRFKRIKRIEPPLVIH